jgi:phage-related minor tail protein
MDLFQSGGKGFDKMVASMIQSIERLVAEILARRAILALIKLLGNLGTSGAVSGASSAATGAVDVVGTSGNLISGASLASAQIIKVEGVLKGKDIYLSGVRYAEVLNNNT